MISKFEWFREKIIVHKVDELFVEVHRVQTTEGTKTDSSKTFHAFNELLINKFISKHGINI